jgi:hypothetical protein
MRKSCTMRRIDPLETGGSGQDFCKFPRIAHAETFRSLYFAGVTTLWTFVTHNFLQSYLVGYLKRSKTYLQRRPNVRTIYSAIVTGNYGHRRR